MENCGFKEIISEEEIAVKVKEFGAMLDEKYPLNNLSILIVMKGAICLAADLIRSMKTSPRIEYVACNSYKETERGKLAFRFLSSEFFDGREVLIVDDICDSGFTLKLLTKIAYSRLATTVKSLVLLRREMKNESGFTPDYSLFTINKEDFVIGYGMDHNELYRGMKGVSILNGREAMNDDE